MKIMILFLALAAGVGLVKAQETRIEAVKPTTSFDDSRPNNDSIPAVYSVDGRFDRILVVRLKHQADLLQCVEQWVKQNNIANAVILSGIGSVRSYHYHTVTNRAFPSKVVYVKDPTASADMLNMNGYIINGRVHAHVTLADAGKAFGGHLEVGTEVFTFAVVTVGVLNDGLDLTRVDDKTYR